MEIITRIPPAYFIPVEKTEKEPFRWINVAHVTSIDVIENLVYVYIDGGEKVILDGDRASAFLNEIDRLNARYRVSVAD